MIAVIFEALPAEGEEDRYLDLAGLLKSRLETMDGFVSVERFRSLVDPGKLLSLSFWRDEAAVAAWRNTPQHRGAQQVGRREVLRDYRLRIAAVTRDYGQFDRAEAPRDSRETHDQDGRTAAPGLTQPMAL